MAAVDFDLEKLLQPLSIERFFAEYWEKQPLYLPRRAPDYYAGLLTQRDLESLISNTDLRYPAIQLSKGGGYLPPEAPGCNACCRTRPYVDPGPWDGLVVMHRGHA